MTGYLLDTNVVSELRKGDRSASGIREWFAEHQDDELWLSVIVIGELRRGILSIERRDAPSAHRLTIWLESLLDEFGDRVLPISLEVAERWAVLSVPDPVPVADGLIAATALVDDLVVVTRNVSDIDRTGVRWFDPFTGTSST